MTNGRESSLLFRTYRASLKGDRSASRSLIDIAIAHIESGRRLPAGLRRFFVAKLKDPEEFFRIATFSKPKKRGRPSQDEKHLSNNIGLKIAMPFGALPSERNALMIAYLVSQGHPINEWGPVNRESAVALVSQLTGRSTRSLQGDYYKHRVDIEGISSAASWGRSEFENQRKKKEALDRIRKSSR